jgi:WD40 repeat protein
MVEYELEKISSVSPDRICKSPDEKTVSFLTGRTLNSFRQGSLQSTELIDSCIDLALSNDLSFCLSSSGKIHVLDNKDLDEVYIIDLSEENASFSSLSISNKQLILRNEDFAEIRSFQGDLKLRINCSKNTFVFLFDPEIVVLLDEIELSVSITLRHKKQIHQTSLDGRIRQVFADQSSNSIIILLDFGGLYQIDCRHLSPLQKFEIPFKPSRPVENMQFSESTNLIAFQV